jgi:hypothetical protein
MITIAEAVQEFKRLIDTAIKENGEIGKNNVIRSQKPIQFIHDAVKSELIREGISPNIIKPSLNETKPELKLAGYFKQKKQDIIVTPSHLPKSKEELENGLLENTMDEYGHQFTEQSLSINIRSQISSLAKNFDTMYERTILEAFNFHIRCPKMCLGEVYMIAIPEYNSESLKENTISFNRNPKITEKYIKAFQAINERVEFDRNEYKYESVCLLIVDFSNTIPVIYETTDQLMAAYLLPENAVCRIEPLAWNSFTNRLLTIYEKRYGIERLL